MRLRVCNDPGKQRQKMRGHTLNCFASGQFSSVDVTEVHVFMAYRHKQCDRIGNTVNIEATEGTNPKFGKHNLIALPKIEHVNEYLRQTVVCTPPFGLDHFDKLLERKGFIFVCASDNLTGACNRLAKGRIAREVEAERKRVRKKSKRLLHFRAQAPCSQGAKHEVFLCGITHE